MESARIHQLLTAYAVRKWWAPEDMMIDKFHLMHDEGCSTNA